jgi:hypothetical protein
MSVSRRWPTELRQQRGRCEPGGRRQPGLGDVRGGEFVGEAACVCWADPGEGGGCVSELFGGKREGEAEVPFHETGAAEAWAWGEVEAVLAGSYRESGACRPGELRPDGEAAAGAGVAPASELVVDGVEQGIAASGCEGAPVGGEALELLEDADGEQLLEYRACEVGLGAGGCEAVNELRVGADPADPEPVGCANSIRVPVIVL